MYAYYMLWLLVLGCVATPPSTIQQFRALYKTFDKRENFERFKQKRRNYNQ